MHFFTLYLSHRQDSLYYPDMNKIRLILSFMTCSHILYLNEQNVHLFHYTIIYARCAYILFFFLLLYHLLGRSNNPSLICLDNIDLHVVEEEGLPNLNACIVFRL